VIVIPAAAVIVIPADRCKICKPMLAVELQRAGCRE
jgi:hypothetical protein